MRHIFHGLQLKFPVVTVKTGLESFKEILMRAAVHPFFGERGFLLPPVR